MNEILNNYVKSIMFRQDLIYKTYKFRSIEEIYYKDNGKCDKKIVNKIQFNTIYTLK